MIKKSNDSIFNFFNHKNCFKNNRKDFAVVNTHVLFFNRVSDNPDFMTSHFMISQSFMEVNSYAPGGHMIACQLQTSTVRSSWFVIFFLLPDSRI